MQSLVHPRVLDQQLGQIAEGAVAARRVPLALFASAHVHIVHAPYRARREIPPAPLNGRTTLPACRSNTLLTLVSSSGGGRRDQATVPRCNGDSESVASVVPAGCREDCVSPLGSRGQIG